MDIQKIFRIKSTSVEELVKKYQKFKQQKAELENKAVGIKRLALDTDIIDLSAQLQDIRTQIELCDSACLEVEKQLCELVAKQIKQDYESLPKQQIKYQEKLDDLSLEAGQLLGRAVVTLQSLRLPFALVLVDGISKEYAEISKQDRFAPKMGSFRRAYADSVNTKNDAPDFKAWKKRLKDIERLVPGSEAAKAHVRGRKRRLLTGN